MHPTRTATASATGVIDVANSVILAAWREWKLRRDRRLLEAMDDRGLGDIGIGRGGIDGAVHFGRREVEANRPEWSLRHAAHHG